jgi:DNA-binding NtrC family response regulator
MAKILIADDERAICDAFSDFLRIEGHTPLVASGGEEALRLLEQEEPGAVFLDVQMPGMGGLETLDRIHRQRPGLPVIVMTAYGTVQTAMDAMRLGAFDYLGKPVDLAQVRQLLNKALHRPAAASAPLPAIPDPAAGRELIGQSPAMQEIFKLMGLLTGNDLTVLITGESGVGKELAASSIHRHGPRASGPFVAVNCAAIPETLIESELFGHEKGAFSGAESRRIGRCEAAAEGTLFLDEIGDLPYHLQSKLLRVLQERTFERVGSVQSIPLRARIIAATNRDLGELCRHGQFREDLYYRLKLVNLHIPPLRKRSEDIEALAVHLLEQANRELGKRITGIDTEALARLRQHPWPGNVRELEHALKRAALLAHGSRLGIHDLDLDPALAPAGVAPDAFGDLQQAARRALHRALEEVRTQDESRFHQLVGLTEQAIIDEALKLSHGNQVAASELLNLHRTTLRKKLKQPLPE